MTKAERQQLWQTRITEYKASGQRVAVWCEEHGINPQRLWYWLRKEREQTSKESTVSWLPVDLSDTWLETPLLVRVGQVVVEVRSGFDPKLLLDVVNTLVTQ